MVQSKNLTRRRARDDQCSFRRLNLEELTVVFGANFSIRVHEKCSGSKRSHDVYGLRRLNAQQAIHTIFCSLAWYMNGERQRYSHGIVGRSVLDPWAQTLHYTNNKGRLSEVQEYFPLIRFFS